MVKPRAAAPRRAKAQRTPDRRDDTQRIAELIDLVTEAKRGADQIGERFLAYLLAMVILEMSHIDSRRAASKRAAAGKPKADPPTPPGD